MSLSGASKDSILEGRYLFLGSNEIHTDALLPKFVLYLLLLLYQMLQVLIIGYTLQLVLDNLLDIFLDLVVVILYGLLHAVIAIGILEVVDDGDWLIVTLLSLYLVGIYNNFGMEYLLFDALVKVVGNRADKHTLGKSANLARWNKTIHLGVDGCRDILSVDGNGLALLKYLSKTLG